MYFEINGWSIDGEKNQYKYSISQILATEDFQLKNNINTDSTIIKKWIYCYLLAKYKIVLYPRILLVFYFLFLFYLWILILDLLKIKLYNLFNFFLFCLGLVTRIVNLIC